MGLELLDINKLSRDYREVPLEFGELPSKKDLEYLYLELNLTLKELADFFGNSIGSCLHKIKVYGIKKDSKRLTITRRKKKAERYGNPNYNNRKKAKNTTKEKYGYENAMQNPEIALKCVTSNIQNHEGKHFMQTEEALPIIKNMPHPVFYGKDNIFSNSAYIQECFAKKHDGAINPGQIEEFKLKAKQTSIEKYGVDNYNKTEECKERIRQTCLERYGVTNYTKSSQYKDKYKNKIYVEEVTRKTYQTKKINQSFTTSKLESIIYNLLKEKFPDCKRWYKEDPKYPFECDFYISFLDLFIEINFHWTHGFHPYNPQDPKDQETVRLWKEKAKELNYKGKPKDFYKNAIYTWTVRDPLKRETARKNNLNWLEFFSMEEFLTWYDNFNEEF